MKLQSNGDSAKPKRKTTTVACRKAKQLHQKCCSGSIICTYECLEAGRTDENVLGVEVRLLDALDALHVDVEDTDATLFLDVLHRRDAATRGR